MELAEGLVVAERFRLVRMIGRGGMGSVWQAVHLSLDQPCAVKFIEGELGNLAEAHARFEREAKAAAQLRSPHVVQILDHGVWQGRPYIAMELLEGEDLGKALLRAGGKLPPGQVATVVQQVARALTKAHAAGVVHRDLKPDNIFLVQDDDQKLVKILDFGVAKQTSHTIEGSNTKTGAMLGTPYYMSPEQAQGIKTVDSRSDLWSLAVIVFQCITGRLPFESEALGDLLVKIIVAPVPVPSKIASVPPGFDKWWARAAERDPDKRFQSAKEFANDLSLAVGGTALLESTNASQPLIETALLTGPRTPAPHLSPPIGTPPPGPSPLVTPSPFGEGRGGEGLAPQPYSAHSSSGTAASFSGNVPGVKKGVPIAAVVAGAVLAAVGLGTVGYVVTHRSSASAGNTPTAPSASVVVASAAPASSPSAAESVAAPPPIASASASATPEPAAEPPVVKAGVGVKPHVGTRPTATAVVVAPTAPPKPTASAAPTASVKRWTPGF
jgi:serine/threonine protein kinase